MSNENKNNNENIEQQTTSKHWWKKLLGLNPTYELENVPAISNQQHIIKFEDGSYVEFNRETQMLTMVAKTINFIGDIVHTGKFENTDGIISNSEIADNISSMQEIRDKYNIHTHTGNQGSPTSAPDKRM
jgi:hypothetical protein